ncbi:putative cardiolipin synthase (CMP-forming) [Oratosquilla oratoria]|uniref:putative cardiolipin synthase (CMP-forming) n=1 Tax=Oratosquilla oratoria TaxID=337810 RepID=UPI003F763501
MVSCVLLAGCSLKMKHYHFCHFLLKQQLQRSVFQRGKHRPLIILGYRMLSLYAESTVKQVNPSLASFVGRPKSTRTWCDSSMFSFQKFSDENSLRCSSLSWNLNCIRTLYSSSSNRNVDDQREGNPTSTPSGSQQAWKILKEKENKIREARKELMDDFKETKAKVMERMEEVVERENIWTIPNFLCVSRILMSPFLGYLVVSGMYSWSLGIFIFAGFTDLIDGWIARQFPGQASRLGSFLDPLADKVLVAVLFLTLTYNGLIPLPLTGLIIYRDVLIIGGASVVRFKSLPPPRTVSRYFDATHATAQLAPTTISKVNTAIQLGLITASLAAPVFAFTDHYLLHALWWFTAATTLSSGISYIFSNNTYKMIKKMEEQKKS